MVKLPNNMTALLHGDHLMRDIRERWNTNFSRCVVRVTAGKGIRVDEKNGEVVVSAVNGDVQDGENSQQQPQPFLVGGTVLYTGDNIWIRVTGTVIEHIAAAVSYGTHNVYPIGSSSSGGSVSFHQQVYRHDSNGHIMGTHLGSGTIHTEGMFTIGTQRRVHQTVFDGSTFREIWSIDWVILGGGTGTASTTIFTGTTC